MDCTHCALVDGSSADRFVDEWIHDCLYTGRDWMGLGLQMISIGAWVVAQVPQFISNYKNESAEALSPWFLAEWLVGDSSNLAGCLLTGTQLPLTTGTAWYYLSCDTILISQYVYYSAKEARRVRTAEHDAKRSAIRAAAEAANVYLHEYEELNGSVSYSASGEAATPQMLSVHSSPLPLDQLDTAWHVHSLPVASGESIGHADAGTSTGTRTVPLASPQGPAGTGLHRSAATVLGLGPGLMLACIFTAALVVMMATWTWIGRDEAAFMLGSTDQALKRGELPKCPVPQLPSWAQTAGLILGYISATCYLKSRVSQLVKNLTRGDAEGLSAGMFLCAITGNVTGAAGILVRLDNAEQFMQQLPWLIGMLGTVSMDVVIASQSWAAAAKADDVPTPNSTNDNVQADTNASQNPNESAPLLPGVA